MVQHVAEPSEDVDDRQGVYTAAQSKGGLCQLPIHTQRKHQPTLPANCAMRQQQRPATAHGGPAARPASRGAATTAGDSKHDRTPVNTVNKPVNYSALARLKAEIAEVAAYQNIQLQSLKPLCSLDAAVLTGDSSAELPLQVLDDAELLQQLALTYTEARQQSRKAAAQAVPNDHPASDEHSSSSSSRRSVLKQSKEGVVSSIARTVSADISALVAEIQGGSSYSAQAAKAELHNMRQWVAEQDVKLLEPGVAALFSNKTVAARISQLQSENKVLQYQRQHYEAALTLLRSDRFYGSCAPWRQRPDTLEPMNDSQSATSAGATVLADNMQHPHHPHVAHHAQCTVHDTARDRDGTAADCTRMKRLPSLGIDSSDSVISSRSSSSDTGGTCVRGQHPITTAAETYNRAMLSGHQCHVRQRIGLLKQADITAEEQAEQSGLRVTCGYSGTSGNALLQRCVGPDTDVLQLSHCGLRPQQLDKVAAALDAAPWITKLDLSGNLLTDQAVAHLVQLMFSIPSAAGVTHVDLSQNQLLTWRCCSALGLLMHQPQARLQPGTKSGRRTSRCTASGLLMTGSGALTSTMVTNGSAGLNNPDSFFLAGPVNSRPSSALASGVQRQPNQRQYLQLRSLSLQGVAIGDKGAVQLAGSLATASSMQVLCLAHCGLHDSGGAAVCSAVRQHSSIMDLDLSWNALGHCTARAAEAALRCPDCHLACLRMSHCGLDDRDGARVLDALTPANSQIAYSSSSGGSTASKALLQQSASTAPSHWKLLDLSYNNMEGGAAVCAAAVIAAVCSEATPLAVEAACGIQQLQCPEQRSNSRPMSAGASPHRVNTEDWMSSSSELSDTCRTLLLDGNPLGIAGVRCIARAMAGQPLIGVLDIVDSSAGCGKGTAARDSVALLDVNAAPCEPATAAATDTATDLAAEPSLALSVSAEEIKASKSAQTAATSAVQHPAQQQQESFQSVLQYQHPALHVSIAKVTLVAKEKGVRSSLRDTHASGVATSQVATLLDALNITEKPKLVGVNTSSTSGSKDSMGPSSSSSSKPVSAKGSLPLAASGSPDADLLVISETAAGFDLTCPGGQYRLQLRHPAVRHLVHQLLHQRLKLQHFQQQVKELQQQQLQIQQQQLEPKLYNTRPSSPEPYTMLLEGATGTVAMSTTSSRRTTREPSTTGQRVTTGSGSATVSRPATASGARSPGSTPGTAAASTSRPTSSTGGSRQAKRRALLSCPVSIPTLQDVKLDGRAVKAEQLLELQPWYKPPPPGFSSSDGSGITAIDGATGDSAAGDRGAAGRPATADVAAGSMTKSGNGGADVKKQKGKGKKVYKQLEFTVKAAAVLAGHEAPVMPTQLLQWVLKVMADPAASDVWKLQLLELLLPDWLLTPQQAGELLNMFDKDLGQDEKLSAAGLIWARLAQPMDFWDQVSPVALKPMQQQQFRDMLGPTLMTLDRQNLTGQYTLNLNWAVHRAVARRLQVTALQESATSECRYYVCWRNASMNGVDLPEVAITQLQDFAIPSSGTLKLDYVSYQVPKPSDLPASASQLQSLQAGLRALHNNFHRHLLALRAEYLPGGLTKSEEEEKAAAAKARLNKRPTRAAASSSGPRMTNTASPATGSDSADASNQKLSATGASGTWWEASGLDPSALLMKFSNSMSAASRQATRPGTASSVAGNSAAAVSDRVRKERAPSTAGSRRPLSASSTGANKTPAASKAAASKALPRSSFSAAGSSTRVASSAGSRRVGVTDDELLARLLAASSPQQVAALIPALGEVRAAAVMTLLASMPAGAAALAALMECLPPLVVARYLQDVPGISGLLPAALRAKVTPLLKPALGKAIKQVASAVSAAAVECANQQLALIRRFAAQTSGISCNQLVTILQLLKVQGWRYRCGVIVALWAKVVDRNRLVEVFEGLSGSEQLGLMSALGSYHVWSTLARPDGLHFRLDLTQAEQRDVAREVVKEAVRRSATERETSAARAHHLVNLLAEGKPVLDPEDDKLWLSLESKHTLLEFDFARTWEQELHLMVEAVKRIQRAWRKLSIRRGLSPEPAAATGGVGSVPGVLNTAGFRGDRPVGNLESANSRISGYSSELSMAYSSDLTGDSSNMYTGTAGSSVFTTPYSLSALSSEVSLCVQSTNVQQPHEPQQSHGGMCLALGALGKANAGHSVMAESGIDCSNGRQITLLSTQAADSSGTGAGSIDLTHGSARSFAAALPLPDSTKPTPRLF